MSTKKEGKIGVVSCKLQALSIVIKLWPSNFLSFFYFFIFCQIPFVWFLVILLAFVFSPPTKTLLFEIFLVTSCELLTSSMSFSSLVMNDHLMKRWSQYLQTMITTLLLTTCHKQMESYIMLRLFLFLVMIHMYEIYT